MTLIGGHRKQPTNDGPGLDVLRTPEGIVKKAYTEGDLEGIRNEARFLRILEGTGFAPKLLAVAEDSILQEDLGETEKVKDGEAFRRNCTRLLWALRRHGVRHGDLTWKNVIIRNDVPIAIDFQQSNLIRGEAPPQKRPLSDSYYLWRWAMETPAEEHPTPDTPRVIRRWLAVLSSIQGGLSPTRSLSGKTLCDLGCFQGDFCAMAAVEGIWAYGVDQGGFQQGSNSIEIANELWKPMVEVKGDPLFPGCSFDQTNLMDQQDFSFDFVLLFSTWSYIVKDFGKTLALDLLKRIVDSCGALFFENQLNGDGPGPDFLLDETDIGNMLGEFGHPQQLITIPVMGREASRSVWKVTKY